jgi:hypothetical protein
MRARTNTNIHTLAHTDLQHDLTQTEPPTHTHHYSFLNYSFSPQVVSFVSDKDKKKTSRQSLQGEIAPKRILLSFVNSEKETIRTRYM